MYGEKLSGNLFQGTGKSINIPTRESIYKALLTNHKIMENQKSTLAKLAEDIKQLKIRNITTPSWDPVSLKRSCSAATLSR